MAAWYNSTWGTGVRTALYSAARPGNSPGTFTGRIWYPDVAEVLGCRRGYCQRRKVMGKIEYGQHPIRIAEIADLSNNHNFCPQPVSSDVVHIKVILYIRLYRLILFTIVYYLRNLELYNERKFLCKTYRDCCCEQISTWMASFETIVVKGYDNSKICDFCDFSWDCGTTWHPGQ